MTARFFIGGAARSQGKYVTLTGGLTWRDVPGNYTLVADDQNNGLSTSGSAGTQTITIPPDADVTTDVGSAVLIFGYGAAAVEVVGGSGVTVLVRSPLLAELAGQYATATIIKHAANTWLICGDLGT